MSRTQSIAPVAPDDIAEIDERIHCVEAELLARTARWRELGPTTRVSLITAGPAYDPRRRAAKVRAAIDVDEVRVALERLKADRARFLLAEVSDTATDTILAADRDAARSRVQEVEAELRRANVDFALLQGALDQRKARRVELENMITGHEVTIASVQSIAAKERAELDSLERYDDLRAGLGRSVMSEALG